MNDLITPPIKTLIQHILNAMETGSAAGDYANISIMADGPGNTRQITYGRSQTTETGNLRKLVLKYIANNGKYAQSFKRYVDGTGDDEIGINRLVHNSEFITLLKMAGTEDPIMISSQDEFFDEEYWTPAYMFFKRENFLFPLSMLVIYDSYIQSGRILEFLRQKFSEKTPLVGGNEKQWIHEYIDVRHQWMRTHQRPAVRASIYRTNDYKRLITQENWMLDQLPIMANGVKINS